MQKVGEKSFDKGDNLPPDEKEQVLNKDPRLDHNNEDEDSDKDDNADGQIVSFG